MNKARRLARTKTQNRNRHDRRNVRVCVSAHSAFTARSIARVLHLRMPARLFIV